MLRLDRLMFYFIRKYFLFRNRFSIHAIYAVPTIQSFFFLFADTPIVTLKMGSSLNPDDIKEGDGVYFECNIRANPKPYKMTWYHDVSNTLVVVEPTIFRVLLFHRDDDHLPLHHVAMFHSRF